MLGTYKFIITPHHKLHDNIMAFFDRIEFETGDYSIDFYDVNFYNDILSHHKKIIEEPLKQIFEIIKIWEQDKRTKFCKQIRDSNDIQRICKREVIASKICDIDNEITSKVDIKKLFSDLYKQVLYGDYCKISYGDLQSHFVKFKVPENEIFKCPFCGIISSNTKEEKKDDYDHFLPHSKYPFSSVNFKNLSPICVDCNSDYKKDRDILDNGGKKLFFTYDNSHTGIIVEANLEDEKELDFSFSYKTFDNRVEEIGSWDDIFSITKRYKARAKGKADNWFRHYWEFLEDLSYKEVDFETKKKIYLSISKKDPDKEVIKAPVIKAMEESKLSKAYQDSAKYKMVFEK